MPFVLREVAPAPKFVLEPIENHNPTPEENDCTGRINALVEQILQIIGDDTPRGREAQIARGDFIRQLRARSEDFVAGRLSVTEFYLTSFSYEGRLEERLARVRAAEITIGPYSDSENPDLYVDIQYDISQGTTTKEEVDLKRSIDKAVTVVKVVMTGKGGNPIKQHEYIRDLVNIGRIGLFEGNVELAKSTLENLQEEFVAREASWVKNRYVNRLGCFSAFFIILFTIAYLLIRHEAESGMDWRLWLLPDAPRPISHAFALYRFRNFFLLAIGASFSAWLAFLIRAPKLEFSGLVQLDDDLLTPVTRVLFTIGLSFVVGLLFWTGLISITIGRFTTHFENAGTTAILIGVFCGVASRALATAVSRRADEFAGNVGATPAQNER